MPSMNVKEIRLDSVFFQVNPHYKENGGQDGFAYGLRIDTRLSEEDSSIRVRLGVETPEMEKNPDYPFFFDVKYLGIFDFATPIDEDSRRQLASINCPAILYPYLRETLADLTRRAGFPPLHLPVTNFMKLANSEDMKAQQPTSEKTAATGKSARKPVERKRKPSVKAK